MAVFLINICKFNGCGITFPSLGDLIQHIEDTHIDYDPQVIEQKEQSRPACLPLSYVLRFITDAARKEGPFLGTSGAELKRKLAIKHHSYSMSSSNRSNTPTDIGSEMDEDELMPSDPEDSNDSWTTEEFSSEFIMRYGSRHSGPVGNSTTNEKPFACPVPGCKKRYKNVNGIKYHSKNGHKKDGKVRKGFKCHCGKSYKTPQGLKNHSLQTHGHSATNVLQQQQQQQQPGSSDSQQQLIVASSSPSATGSLSPSSASNASGGSSNSNSNHQPVHNSQSQQNHHHQSQLSPNSSSISSSAASNVVVVNNHNHNNLQQQQQQQHHQSPSSGAGAGTATKGNFGMISMKNKSGGGPSAYKAAGDSSGGVKQSLPSLVNLGILTPATSPKHHHQQQQQQLLTPQTPTNNGGMHPLQQQQLQQQQHASAGGDHHLLPLTPISPNMSKSLQYTSNNNGGGGGPTTHTNQMIHCNASSNAAAEHCIAEET